MGALRTLLLVVTLASSGRMPGCRASDSAYRLYEDMMKDYNPLIIPAKNHTDVMEVFVGLTLSQIVDIDEQNQIMITSLWLKQRWKDFHFVWNPDDYGGLKKMQVPIDQLWNPDIVLYNTADGNYAVNVVNRATVRYDGTVSWSPPAIFRSSCLIDISYFPFDEQRCKMKFGSWTHSGSQLDLSPLSPRVEREDFRANGEWESVETVIEKHAIRYPCCPEIYVDMTYTFVLHRNPLFYVITLVVPCILIAILTALIFYLPSEAQEKITLCISVLLALIVFLLLIPSMIPPTATTTPLIAKYMLFTMAINSVSIVATVWTINLHFRNANSHTMGKWTRRILLELMPRLLLMRRPAPGGDPAASAGTRKEPKTMEHCVIRNNSPGAFIRKPGLKATDPASSSSSAGAAGTSTGTSSNNNNREPGPATAGAGASSARSAPPRDGVCAPERSSTPKRFNEYKPVRKEWRRLLNSLNYIQNNLKEADRVEDSEDEWAFVGLVIDRFLLWVFTVTVLVGSVAFFIQAPIFWEGPDAHVTEVYEDPQILQSVGYYDMYPTAPPLTTE